MHAVRIAAAAVAHPPHRVTQDEACDAILRAAAGGGRVARGWTRLSGAERRLRALARRTAIRERRTIIPPEDVVHLGSIAERNATYQPHAHALAAEAASAVLTSAPAVRAAVTSSCTGYSLPGWGATLVETLGLPPNTVRLPITEAGCAGGVVAIARATDHLRVRDGHALAVACEICSLAFHAGGDDGNLTSSLLFGDGAGAARLESGAGAGLEVLDSASALIPNSRHALGFALTDAGFYPLLSRDLVDVLVPAFETAVRDFLAGHELAPGDVGAWLLHPGGARILDQISARLALGPEQLSFSRVSLEEFGNTSSAAIFDVLRRYLAEPAPPGELGVVAAFGPGVAIEMLLVRRC